MMTMPAHARFVCSLVVAGLVAAVGTARAQSLPPEINLDSVAADLAKAIRKGKAKRVLVGEILDATPSRTRLGELLREELSAALARADQRLTALDHKLWLDVVKQDRLDVRQVANVDVARWIAHAIDAQAVIVGELKPIPRAIDLHLKVLFAEKDEVRSVTLSIVRTPDLEALLAQPVFLVDDVAAEFADLPEAGRNGISRPTCVLCLDPPFTDWARRARCSGVVALLVEVTTEGRPGRIRVIKGLPCGLSRAAVDSIRRWRFNPATGPDGRPVAVRVLIEVSFRLLDSGSASTCGQGGQRTQGEDVCAGATLAGVDGVTLPKCVSCKGPSYTRAARVAKYQGRITLQLRVGPEGNVERIVIQGKFLEHGMTEEVIKAVRGWRFEPPRDRSGHPVTTCFPMELVFKLV